MNQVIFFEDVAPKFLHCFFYLPRTIFIDFRFNEVNNGAELARPLAQVVDNMVDGIA